MEYYYETNLIWKEIHALLSDSKYGSTGSFINSVKNLRCTSKIQVHDNIMQEKRANEIIQKVKVEEMNETVTERAFYLPHRSVMTESAETMKVRIVHDTSTTVCQTSTSLNE